MPKRSQTSSLLAHAMYWNSSTRVFTDLPESLQLYILDFVGSSRPVKPRKVYDDYVTYEFDLDELLPTAVEMVAVYESDVEEVVEYEFVANKKKKDDDSDYDPDEE